MVKRPRLTLLQKSLLALGSSLGALVDPLRAVASLGEVTGKNAARYMREKMLSSTSGRSILKSQREINSRTLNMDYLRCLPDTSFGKQHYLFFATNNLSPDTRAKVQYIEDDELAFVLQRYRENHDYMHTLCGLPVSVVAELGLKWFEFRQTRLPMAFFGSIFGPLMLSGLELCDFYNFYLPWANSAGKTSYFFMNFDFESHFERDISDVRRLLNLTPFSTELLLSADKK